MERKQSKAVVTVMQEANDSHALATKSEIESLKQHLDHSFEQIDTHVENALAKQTNRLAALSVIALGVCAAILMFL
jgi:hypothetical protein